MITLNYLMSRLVKSNFLYEDDLNWKIIEASLSTLTLNDEEIHFNS